MFKKGKNIFSLLIIIASIFMTGSTNMIEAQGSGNLSETGTVDTSKDWGNQFITKAQLQDANGEVKNSFGLYEDIYANWEFSTNNQKINNGDTMKITVPKQFTITNNIVNSKTLKDKNGNEIATITLDKTSRIITVTFNNYAATKSKTSNVTGWISLKTNWNKNLITANQNVNIDWNLDKSVINNPDSTTSATVTPPSNNQNDNTILYKYGSFDKDKILWNVEINYSGEKISKASYRDFIGENQDLIANSIKVNSATLETDGSVTNDKENQYTNAKVTYGDDNKSFSIDLGDISQPINISYYTKITNYDNLSDNYSNSGDLLSGTKIEQNITVNDSTTSIGGSASTSGILISPLGQKTWSVPSGVTLPKSITVHLLRRNNEKDEYEDVVQQKVSADSNWQYIFRNQPKYDSQGNLYQYTVKEEPIKGFTPVYNSTNYDITNYPSETFKVTKIWHDGNNAQGTRPDSVLVHLFDDKNQAGSTKSINLSDANNWTYTYTDLPYVENDNWYVSEIGYDGKQTNTIPKGYIKTQYANNGNPQDQTIINTLATSLTVKKEWKNDDKLSRPESVKVQLYSYYSNDEKKDYTKVGDPVTLNSQNNWSYSFGTNSNTENKDDSTNQLPKYDKNDKELNYLAKEIDTPTGYTVSNSFNNDKTIETITNTKKKDSSTDTETDKTKDFTVTKKWHDDNNANRPKSIQVQLLANGNPQGDIVKITPDKDNNWTYTWTNLDKNVDYSAKELNTDTKYTTNVDKIDDNHITITNTLKSDSNGTTPTPNNPDNPQPETPSTSDKTPTEPHPDTPSVERDPDPDTSLVPDTPIIPNVPNTSTNTSKNSNSVIPTKSLTPNTDKTRNFDPDPMVPKLPYDTTKLPQTGNQKSKWFYPLIGLMILGLLIFKTKKRMSTTTD
ncbi:Cna B-type domain-containing protein [Companilactobacillus alimentarius]|uniref:Cna B-type domain-containing protein n=1 Tax=Companilactobacillus alimentarius TaxID=1602 RepID=UPI003D7C60F8